MTKILNELAVLNSVADEMKSLTRDEQRRVVLWLADYYGVYDDEYDVRELDDEDVVDFSEPVTVVITDEPEAEVEVAPEVEAAPESLTFAGFYEKVAPKTAIQKIVTAAYWLETQDGKESWKSFEVNKLLKSIDVKLSSVSGTLAIDAKKDSPLIVVLDKSGDSMQSRKTFALSAVGQQFVEDRLD